MDSRVKFIGPVSSSHAIFPSDRSTLSTVAEILRVNGFQFQMAAIHHLGFLKVRNFNCPSGTEGQYASPSQISCQSVELLQRHGRLSISQDGDVRHLRFLNVGNFTYRSATEGQYASPCQILCRSVKLLPIFDCLLWQPYAMCDLFYVYLERLWRALVVFCHCAKFGWNQCSSFDNMPVLMFCKFGLKMPIHSPFGWFLGI